jgi:inorganic pyrophosphatase
MRSVLVTALSMLLGAIQTAGAPPRTLPASATEHLVADLAASRQQAANVWRDTVPVNADGTVNAYIEIPLNETRKYEFDIKTNARFVDRVMPPQVGGYPVNYGFVPQTISYDGDPFDVLVLGPALPGGKVVRGIPLGVMFMEDEKGLDSKVVVSPPDRDGRPQFALTPVDQEKIGTYFAHYKEHEPGKFSKVPGWGSAAEGMAYVVTTHAFFTKCKSTSGPCVLK